MAGGERKWWGPSQQCCGAGTHRTPMQARLRPGRATLMDRVMAGWHSSAAAPPPRPHSGKSNQGRPTRRRAAARGPKCPPRRLGAGGVAGGEWRGECGGGRGGPRARAACGEAGSARCNQGVLCREEAARPGHRAAEAAQPPALCVRLVAALGAGGGPQQPTPRSRALASPEAAAAASCPLARLISSGTCGGRPMEGAGAPVPLCVDTPWLRP
jgi:hypothetical protein